MEVNQPGAVPEYNTSNSPNVATNDVKINLGHIMAERPLDVERKSFQLRALARKTIAYQKRQYVVNCCCVVICPFMMVMIAGVLAIIINNLIAAGNKNSTVVFQKYCSKVAFLNENGVPLVFNDTEYLQNSNNVGKTIDLNYFQIQTSNSTPIPCFMNFENDYAYFEPFARDSEASRTRDTTFLADPKLGWFSSNYSVTLASVSFPIVGLPKIGQTANPQDSKIYPLYNKIYEVQKFPSTFVFAASGVDIGTRSQGSIISDISQLSSSSSGDSGFLGNFIRSYYEYSALVGNTTKVIYIPSDKFIPVSSSDIQAIGATDPDSFIYNSIMNIVYTYEDAFQPKYNKDGSVTYPQVGGPAQLAFLSSDNISITYPFFGGLYINSLDVNAGKISATIQVDIVDRLNLAMGIFSKSASFFGVPYGLSGLLPSVGQRLLYEISQISNAMLKSSPNSKSQTTRISHSFLAMPYSKVWSSLDLPVDLGVQIGKSSYPFGLSFLVPIFVLILVKEKEDRIQVMMRMHGLTSLTYYISHYVHFFILQLICSIVFIISGVAFQLKFFTQTDPGVYIILLLVWANQMVAISFLLSIFFSKSRFALLATFGIVFLSCMMTLFESLIFKYQPPPNWWFLWPFWAFFRGLNVIGDASSGIDRRPYIMSDLTGSDEVLKSILFLLFEGIFGFFLTAYLNQIIPTEYGISKPWHFIFTEPYEFFRHHYLKNQGIDVKEEKLTELKLTDEEKKILDEYEDDDVKNENKKVHSFPLTLETFEEYPLIVKDVRKVYSAGKVANKQMNLAVEKHIVFGLLGPNGAGKTTLIQMLTGLYPPTSGNAYIAGFNIQNDMSQIYLNIGVCPQHDILWDDLTIEEHLLFYARLRGIPADQERESIKKAIAEVELQEHAKKQAKQLSGGQKRRLSIAIAVTGDVPLVFLDEPTTGLDPEVRRMIWNVIQNAKQGKTIILTTHSMEEADILSSKIGIMSKGVLRCVGSPLHLKRKYGRGFKVTASFYKELDLKAKKEKIKVMSREDACRWIEDQLPAGKWKKVDQGGVVGSVTYEFDDDSGNEKGVVTNLLEKMEQKKDELGVEDWGISLSTLDEVFLNIISHEDSNAVV